MTFYQNSIAILALISLPALSSEVELDYARIIAGDGTKVVCSFKAGSAIEKRQCVDIMGHYSINNPYLYSTFEYRANSYRDEKMPLESRSFNQIFSDVYSAFAGDVLSKKDNQEEMIASLTISSMRSNETFSFRTKYGGREFKNYIYVPQNIATQIDLGNESNIDHMIEYQVEFQCYNYHKEKQLDCLNLYPQFDTSMLKYLGKQVNSLSIGISSDTDHVRHFLYFSAGNTLNVSIHTNIPSTTTDKPSIKASLSYNAQKALAQEILSSPIIIEKLDTYKIEFEKSSHGKIDTVDFDVDFAKFAVNSIHDFFFDFDHSNYDPENNKLRKVYFSHSGD